MPFEEGDRKVLQSLTGKAKQVRARDTGSVWSVTPDSRTRLDDPNLRGWLVDAGLLERDAIEVDGEWVMSELPVVGPEQDIEDVLTQLAQMRELLWAVAGTFGAEPGKPGTLPGGGGIGTGAPVIDVDASLARATAEQLALVGAPKLFAALGIALNKANPPAAA